MSLAALAASADDVYSAGPLSAAPHEGRWAVMHAGGYLGFAASRAEAVALVDVLRDGVIPLAPAKP